MSPGAWDDQMASFIFLRRQISAARGEGRLQLQENAVVLAIHIELTLCFCSAAASAALQEHNAWCHDVMSL